MKVKITNEGLNTHKVKVLVDGIDITRNLTDINVNIKAGEIPTLKLEFVPDEMQIDGDYEVIKKLFKEEDNLHVKNEKINNKYTKFAEKIKSLAKTVDELAVMEYESDNGVDISEDEAYSLVGKFMMQIMDLQEGIPG
ncbi:hypothetical protein [Clostridium butyricum]|uniref:hypothetical protein n=2 Tax=Clostridium butyricum TaxID=1492 RepID=UPI0002D1996B|nr:hypothetical protein [Clostridium butyricum]ENZ33298.1 hypothetical protein HMPREF1084_01766 [Clostridium butyricum 60E.3]MDU1340536.1 hypothetical protein [Clostridium butyricum]MDU5104795.1 hypothetical protein [Clostridium butyricum]DAJ73812.1 MAG TPA: hypothetical protein [Caudoviricetes sp.]